MNNKSYVMWNNKGGVGKSTITFHIASVYAEVNPDRDVIIIDMCPQANSSAMLMGGGKNSELKLQELISKTEPQSVVGYITEATLKGDADINKYITKLIDVNDNLSEKYIFNVWRWEFRINSAVTFRESRSNSIICR